MPKNEQFSNAYSEDDLKTNKVLDTTFTGLTPYLPTHLKSFDPKSYSCKPIKLPQLWDTFEESGDFQTDLSRVREFIKNNSECVYWC